MVRCGSSRTPLLSAFGSDPGRLCCGTTAATAYSGLHSRWGGVERGFATGAGDPASTRRHQRPRCSIVQQVPTWHDKIPIDSRRASRAGTHGGRAFVRVRAAGKACKRRRRAVAGTWPREAHKRKEPAAARANRCASRAGTHTGTWLEGLAEWWRRVECARDA